MSRSATHFPPPSEPDARFDAVVARGERLRRRDRATRGLVTAGALGTVVVAVVVVGLLASGRSTDQSPASRPDGATHAVGVPDGDASSTTVTVLDRLTVRPAFTDGRVEVRVDDPHFAVTDTSKLCVRIRIQPEGPAQVATAAGETCWTPTDGDVTTVAAANPTNGVELGCGGVQVQQGDPATTTVAPSTTLVGHGFAFTLPVELPPGRYVAEVTAVSSTNDGCETSSPGDDDEYSTASVAFDRR